MDESMSSDRAIPVTVCDFLPTTSTTATSTTASVKIVNFAGFGPPPKGKYKHMSICRCYAPHIKYDFMKLL